MSSFDYKLGVFAMLFVFVLAVYWERYCRYTPQPESRWMSIYSTLARCVFLYLPVGYLSLSLLGILSLLLTEYLSWFRQHVQVAIVVAFAALVVFDRLRARSAGLKP